MSTTDTIQLSLSRARRQGHLSRYNGKPTPFELAVGISADRILSIESGAAASKEEIQTLADKLGATA